MLNLIIDSFIQLLVIINPFSKIIYIAGLRDEYTKRELLIITLKSNIFAFIILSIFACFGTWLLRDFFHIDISALRIAGGIIVAKIGYDYISKEINNREERKDINEISTIPLGVPLIAGPGAITLAIALSYERGVLITIIGAFIAIFLNGLIMAGVAEEIEKLKKLLIVVMVKVIGLFILAIGVQMVLIGLKEYVMTLVSEGIL